MVAVASRSLLYVGGDCRITKYVDKNDNPQSSLSITQRTFAYIPSTTSPITEMAGHRMGREPAAW